MANPFPATLSDLQTFVGNQVNDPTNSRYTIALINNQLDIAQTRWNREAKICRFTQTLTTVANQGTYALSLLTVTPMKFLRVAHKGLALNKRSKDYFDQYSAIDWTTDQGTPADFYLDINALAPVIGLHPIPQGNDSGANLQVEFLAPHTPMVNPTDTPFMVNGVANSLILPYVAGLGIEVAAALLEPDPTKETVVKAKLFRQQAEAALSNVVQIYYDLEADEPLRMMGGRNWHH